MKKLFLSFIVLLMTLTATAARPYFVGHRGSRWGVENTKEAFIQGCTRGQFDYLETDIKVTKDKVFICWHDDNTSKYGASNKTIASTNWADLKDIKHTQKRGSKTYTGYLCTMDEYLDICKKYGKRPVIELKWATGINSNDQSNMGKLVQAIKDKGFYETCIILTSMKPCLEWLHENHPKMTLQFLTGQYWENHFTWCKNNGIDVDIQSGTWLTKSTVTKYHNAGLKVNMWTINSVSAYNTHKNMGCDFVTTDYLEPSDFGLTKWEAKEWPEGGSIGDGNDGEDTGGTTTPDPTKSLTVTPTTDITLTGTIGQTEAAPSVTLTVKGENLTTNISANASTGAVIVTKESGWDDLKGGKLKVTLDTDFEKGAGEYSGYVAIQSTSSYRTTINIKATLKAGEGTVTPPVVDDETEEPAQPSNPLAGTHSMSDALWTKSATDYGFANKDNRSIAYYNNALYIPKQSSGQFLVIDAATGNIKSTQTINSADLANDSEKFMVHNLRITTDGQMMLGNTQMASTKVYVNTSSLSGGELSTLGTAAISGRSDYFSIYGSWNKGGNLLALANAGKTLTQIPFTGGSVAPENQITHADLPEGTSAKAFPAADGLSFYASVSGSIPTQHDMTTGAKTGAFTGTAKPKAVNASGLGVFYLHGHTYMVTPASATSGAFDLFDITEGLSKAQLLYSKDPQLGTTANGALTVDFCTNISGNDAYIYVLAPNNGVAAYKFTFTPDGTTTPDQGGTTEPTTPSGPLDGTHSMSGEVWTKKVGDAGINYVAAGDVNRSIIYHNNLLYVHDNTGKLYTVNPTDGAQKSVVTTTLTDYPGWNIRSTTDGQFLGGNTNAGGADVQRAIQINTIDKTTGTTTALTTTATVLKRSDYFYTYGSWSGEGYLIALSNTTTNAVKVPFSGGQLGTPVDITVEGANAGSVTAAKAIPALDGKSFYATVRGGIPTQHDLTGKKIDEFGSEKPVPDNGGTGLNHKTTSGLAVFALHGHTYMIVPLHTLGKFELYDITDGLAAAKKLYTKDPGFTTANNSYTVDFAVNVSGNDAHIYMLVPSNGVVAYTFTFTPKGGVTTSVEDIVSAARILPTFSGVEMFFEGTQSVAVYNVNGMQVAGGVATEHFACDLQSGMYIIRVGNEAYKFVK